MDMWMLNFAVAASAGFIAMFCWQGGFKKLAWFNGVGAVVNIGLGIALLMLKLAGAT